MVRKSAGETQSEKLKKAAREVGADESEEAFKEKLKRLVKAKPKNGNPSS